MSLAAPVLAQSESKAKFLKRLGLNELDRADKNVYSAMKAEAVEGWKRITSKREALAPKCRDNPNIKPPYTFAQINEATMQEETRYIWQTAGPLTREYYDRVLDEHVAPEQNWIIRWLLWHVFRYRDDRNNSNRERKSVQGQVSPNDSEHDDIVRKDSKSFAPLPPITGPLPGKDFYPRPMPATCPSHPPQLSSPSFLSYHYQGKMQSSSERSYYDPVRDV